MQPSLLPPTSKKIPSSIFDAIKDGDYEGLLALYATTAYDAVHSAEFARRGTGGVGIGARGLHRSHSLPLPLTPVSSMMTSGGPRKGVFIEGK